MQQQQAQQSNQSMEFGQMSSPMMNQGGNQIPVPVQQMQETMQHQHMPTQVDFNKMSMMQQQQVNQAQQQQQRMMGPMAMKMNPQAAQVRRQSRQFNGSIDQFFMFLADDECSANDATWHGKSER